MTKVSLKLKLQGQEKVSKEIVAESNDRINGFMKGTVRDFQKKQKISLERASQIVLNA